MTDWTPMQKAAAYEDMRRSAAQVWQAFPSVDPAHQAEWLRQQALRATHPFVAAGADAQTMMFHFGMIMGEMLARTEVTEDVEIDLDKARDPYGQ